MGFNLGMAAIGYNAAEDAQRQQRADSFAQAQQAYQEAMMNESLSHSGQRDNAANLADAQVQAQAAQVQPQAQLALSTIGARQHALDVAQANQPSTDAAAASQAQAAAITADTGVTQAQSVHDWTDADHAMNKDKIDTAIIGSEQNKGQLRQTVLAGMYRDGMSGAVTPGEMAGRLNFLGKTSLFPEFQGADIGNVARVNGPQGPALDIQDKDGNSIHQFPLSELKANYVAANQTKPIAVSRGQTLVQTDPLTHKVSQIYANTTALNDGSSGDVDGLGDTEKARFVREIQKQFTSANPGKSLSTLDALAQYNLLAPKAGMALSRGDLTLGTTTDQAQRDAILAAHMAEAKRALAPGLSTVPSTSSLSPAANAAVLNAIK